MRTCKTCNKPINDLHGNTKTCISCLKRSSHPEPEVTHKEPMMEISVKDFKELERLAKIGKQYLEIDNVLNQKKCTRCLACNHTDGICVLYGVPNEEVN